MSQQLINTSAPKGLKPGSQGFCTVAMTAGLSDAWVARLESLSGYRPIYPLGDAKSQNNPVNFCHWRVSVSGNSRSVLSRVAFYGADYSQRSNRLAAHVLVEPSEQSPGGPAWMMTHANVLQSDWSGEPQHLSAGPDLPKGDRAPRPCAAWSRAMGDAGWGGVLAESFISAPSKPAYVIYTPGTDVLALFEEALSLLPPEKRWAVTFSTFFSELPLNMSCAWRGVVAGTKAAKEAVAMGPRALVLNLTKPPTTAAPDSPYADAARAGSGPVAPRAFAASAPGTAAASAVKATPAKPGNLDDTKVALKVEEELVAASLARGRGDRGKRLGGKPEDFDLKDEPVDLNSLTVGTPPSYKPSPPSKRRGMPWWAVTSIVAACLVIGGIAGYLVYTTNLHAPAQVATTQPAGEASTPLPTTNISPTARPVDEREIARAASDGDKHRNPDKPPSQPNAKPSDTARNGKGNDGQTQQGTPATKPETLDKKGFETPANLIAQKSPSQPTINPSPTETTPAAAIHPLKMAALNDSSIHDDGKGSPPWFHSETAPTECGADGVWALNGKPPLHDGQTLSIAFAKNSTKCMVESNGFNTTELHARGSGRTIELDVSNNTITATTPLGTAVRITLTEAGLKYEWLDKSLGKQYVIPELGKCVFVLKDKDHIVARMRLGQEQIINKLDDSTVAKSGLSLPSGITFQDLILTTNINDKQWQRVPEGGASQKSASKRQLVIKYEKPDKPGDNPSKSSPHFSVTAASDKQGLTVGWDWVKSQGNKLQQLKNDSDALSGITGDAALNYSASAAGQFEYKMMDGLKECVKAYNDAVKDKEQLDGDITKRKPPSPNDAEKAQLKVLENTISTKKASYDELKEKFDKAKAEYYTKWWVEPFDVILQLKNGLVVLKVHVQLSPGLKGSGV